MMDIQESDYENAIIVFVYSGRKKSVCFSERKATEKKSVSASNILSFWANEFFLIKKNYHESYGKRHTQNHLILDSCYKSTGIPPLILFD